MLGVTMPWDFLDQAFPNHQTINYLNNPWTLASSRAGQIVVPRSFPSQHNSQPFQRLPVGRSQARPHATKRHTTRSRGPKQTVCLKTSTRLNRLYAIKKAHNLLGN